MHLGLQACRRALYLEQAHVAVKIPGVGPPRPFARACRCSRWGIAYRRRRCYREGKVTPHALATDARCLSPTGE